MSVTKCLKCEEPVLVPGGASLKAIVRCPLCHEQFELGEMLDEVPPPLEIVEDPEAVAVESVQPFKFDLEGGKQPEPTDVDSEEAASGQSDSAQSVAIESEVESADQSDHAGVAAFEFGDSSSDGGADATATKSTHPAARPRRKGKNPVVEIVKIVAGGALGIALAVVGIWWIAKKDPFKLGPKVSGVAPWIVPERFHGSGDDGDEAKESEDKENSKKRRRPEGIELPQVNSAQNEHIGQRDLSSSPFDARGKSQEAAPKPLTTAQTDGDDNGDIKPIPGPIDRSAPEFLGIRNVETPSADDLEEAVSSAEVAITLWDADLESQQYRQKALEALAHFGKTIASANQTVDTFQKLNKTANKDVLQFLAANPTKLQVVNSWAAQQIKSGRPEVQGVVLAGEVMSIEAMGPLFVNRLELLTDDREEVSLITAVDISTKAPPGAKVIVGGAIVTDPSVNFGGYKGNDQQVIGCGTLSVLQTAPTGTDEK